MLSSLSIKLLPLFLVLALLPFFEGCETATGLFFVHSLTLLALTIAIFSSSRIIIPRFLVYFVPFLLALVVSTVLAPYKYSAVLQLWDYCVAALFAVAVYSFFQNEPNQTPTSLFAIFFVIVLGISISVIFWNNYSGLRVNGTFPNPNDFASFCLLSLIFGIFLLEQLKDRKMRIVVIVCLILLTILVALSSSRGAFLATLLFALLYVLKRKPGKIVSACILAGLVVAGAALMYRFAHYPDPFQYYRLKIWQSSLKGILADPYLGVGLNMLQYNAYRFIFPADVELGRFARVARSADNQYLQILVETGFLGLFTFLIGWFAIYFSLRKTSPRFITLRHSILVVSVLSLFSLALNITAITLLFLFLVCLPLSFHNGERSVTIPLRASGRIACTVFLFLLFAFVVFLPYVADREYNMAISAQDAESARIHLDRAVRYNPYQAYYRFMFVRRVVDSHANLDSVHWMYLVHAIDDSITLNPLESDFYLYRARIFRTLLDQTHRFSFFTEAISSYQAALDKAPYNVFLRGELAAFEAEQGRFSLAQIELEKALSAEPAFLNARLMLAQMKLEQNDPNGARQEIQKMEQYRNRYLNFVPSNNPNYIRALLSVDANRIEEVKKAVDQK